jgi:transposase
MVQYFNMAMPDSHCKNYNVLLTNSNVAVLPWPSKSPDLNPIKHPWGDLDRRARQRQPQPQSFQQLVNALQDEWNKRFEL